MTLLVRDEIDIINPWLDYHRGRVDALIVTDNGSTDGTREELTAAGVEVIDEPGRTYNQDQWVDRMIKKLIDRGIDWVINSDADEFWIGDIRSVIARHHGRENVLLVPSRNYCTTWADDPREMNPIKRVNYRMPANREWAKVIFNTRGFAWNYLGNHDVFFNGQTKKISTRLNESELKINHYNERGWKHYRQKYIQGGEAYRNHPLIADKRYGPTLGYHWRDKYNIYCSGGIEALRCEWEKSIRDPRELIREPLL